MMRTFEQLANIVRAIAAVATAAALVYGVFLINDVREIELGPFKVFYFEAPGAKFKELGAGYQIQFWTPSRRTKETSGVSEWQKFDTDSKLDEFAEKLHDSIVSGYSRYEVTGAGLAPRKVGMWWVATLKKGASVEQFVEAYNKFWMPGSDSLYMETQRISRGYPR
jgi:hypothetical protein